MKKRRTKEVQNMIRARVVQTVFREGDEVVLAEGTYQGTPGVFRRLREDVNWADITERNGNVRSHPVVWLAHSTDQTPGFRKPTTATRMSSRSGSTDYWRDRVSNHTTGESGMQGGLKDERL